MFAFAASLRVDLDVVPDSVTEAAGELTSVASRDSTATSFSGVAGVAWRASAGENVVTVSGSAFQKSMPKARYK
jgi:hypothetical protein